MSSLTVVKLGGHNNCCPPPQVICKRGKRGPQGESGKNGIQGERGPQGVNGTQGKNGVQGDIGRRGPQGEMGHNGIQGAKGPQGEIGQRGPQGEIGQRGPQGEIGIHGVQGSAGINGVQGLFGVNGVQGERGVQGLKGICDCPTICPQETYDAIVSEDGPCDFHSIVDAFNSGAKTVYVRNGTYNETGTIVVPENGLLRGETFGGVVINSNVNPILNVSPTSIILTLTGTISISNGTNSVTGVGTTFSASGVTPGMFIIIGTELYEISTVIDDLNLTITTNYTGISLANVNYLIANLISNITLNNLKIIGTGTNYGIRVVNCQNLVSNNIHVEKCAIGYNLDTIFNSIIENTIVNENFGGFSIIIMFNTNVNNLNSYNNTVVGVNIRGLVSVHGPNTFNNISTNNNSTNIQFLFVIDSTINNLYSSNSLNNGIIVDSGSKLIMNNVISDKHANAGIALFLQSEVILTNFKFRNNQGNGIFTNNSKIVASNGITSGNGFNGISLNQNSLNCIFDSVTSTNNGLRNNGYSGLYADLTSINGKITNSNISNNRLHGIQIESQNWIIKGNNVSSNINIGINIYDNVSSDANIVGNNIITENNCNGIDGITLFRTINNNISNNQIYNNTKLGINITNRINNTSNNLNGSNTVNNNDIKNNLTGIFIDKSFSNNINSNQIYKNTEYGIKITNTSPVNDPNANKGDNDVSNNNINNNTKVSIVIENSSNNNINNNNIYNNLNNVVEILSNSSPTTSDNNIFNGNFINNNAGTGFIIRGTKNRFINNNMYANNPRDINIFPGSIDTIVINNILSTPILDGGTNSIITPNY
jgi:parallel beta-helix repeat protein